MAMQQSGIKRRMYTAPGVLQKVTQKNRPASIYDPPPFGGGKRRTPGRVESRPSPLPAGGHGIGQSSGVGGRLSAGSPTFPGQTSSIGGRLSATPSAHPDPAGAISAGMGSQQSLHGVARDRIPTKQGFSPYRAPPPPDQLEEGIRSRLRPSIHPDPAAAISAGMAPARRALRAGVHMGGEGPTTRGEYMRSLGFLPMGQTQYDWARDGTQTATTPGFGGGFGDAPAMSLGDFRIADNSAGLGLDVANAQNLAKQIEMQQSEAGRSFGVPLSQGEGDESGTYERTVYSNQEGLDLSDPEAEKKATEPSDEERARSEARIRLQMEMNRRAQGDRGDPIDAQDAFDERLEGIDELVEKGFTTYQESLWLLRNGMYVDKHGRVRRTSGLDIEDDEILINLEPDEKGRTVSHEQLAEMLGIDALTSEQQSGVYDPEHGYTELGQQAPGAAGSSESTGEYGFPEGSWEDEMYKAMYENPTPQHSEEDIEAGKRAVQDANRGVYMDAMRAAAYQNQMMGGSADALMGTQADMMRRVSAQNAQQQMAREFQLRDENYRSQIMEAQKKHSVLMDIATKHWGEEAGDLAYARAKEMDRLRMRLQKDYASWADANLGPEWYEQVGSNVAQFGGNLAMAGMMGLAFGGVSDVRLKRNIRKANRPLSTRSGAKADTYFWEWNDIANRLYGLTGASFGVLAQEIEKIAPNAVTVDDNGYRRVNYAMLQEV